MSRAAIIGGGVVGGGWAARFLLNGWDISFHDPDPEAEGRIEAVLANARRALPALYDRALPAEGRLAICATIEEAVSGADWVQESVSDRHDIKHKVHAEIVAALPEGGFIASSGSGLEAFDPGASGTPVIVVQSYNPVYLMPLAELSGDADLCARAATVLAAIGMFPLTRRRESGAFIGNRLVEAVWREALWMLKDGIATTGEIDDAIRMSFGLAWAQAGIFESCRIAGGESGMPHSVAQFCPAQSAPRAGPMDAPELTAGLVAKIREQSDAQSGAHTIRELERIRDDNLVAILRGLRHTGQGAGEVILRHEAGLALPGDIDGLPVTAHRVVPGTWTDYNGHMNEAAYLELGSRATDALMERIGADAVYVAAGKSYFTVDTRIRYLDEIHVNEMLTVTTQVLAGAGKKMHLFHRVVKSCGTLAATIETLLLHTDLTTRRTSEPDAAVARALRRLAEAHAGRDAAGAGGTVGQRG